MSIIQSSAATLTVTFMVDGTPTDPTGNTATIGITRYNGTTLVTGGTATTRTGAGVYTYVLTAANTAQLDLLKATWTGTFSGAATSVVTYHEIVGAHLFTVAQARAWDGGAMSNATTYPTADILDAHDRIMSRWEDICGVSFVPRYRSETIPFGKPDRVFLARQRPLSIISLSAIDSAGTVTAISASYITNARRQTTGLVIFPDAPFSSRTDVLIEYTHGFNPPPPESRDYALMCLRKALVRSNVDDRVTGMTEFGMNWSMTVDPTRSRWFGIPDVDGWLGSQRTPRVA